MQTRIIRDFNKLAPYLSAWNGILNECGNTNPYITPEWIEGWWRFFGSGNELHILMFSDGDEPVGFCPLMMTKRRLYREVRFIGHPKSGRMDFIVRRGYEAQYVRHVTGHLLSLKGAAVCRLHGLNAGDDRNRLMKEALGGKPLVHRQQSYVIDMKSTTGDAFLKSRLSHHTIKRMHNREKTLAKLCDLRFEKASGKDIDAIFPLHEKRWAKKNDGNGFAKGVSREFFRWLAEADRPAPWGVTVHLLKAGNALIAFQYNIEYNGRYTFYRIAHDDTFATYKPGMLVIWKTLEDCFARGIDKADFSTGDEPYKQYWTEDCEWIECVEFGNRSAIAAAVLLAGRAKYYMRNLMKKNEALVHFKRVTLGRIKYFLTGAPALAFSAKTRNIFRKRGLTEAAAFLLGSALGRPIGGARAYAALPCRSGAQGSEITLRTASQDELALICDLTGLEAAEIVERYFKGFRCQILLKSNVPIGYAWLGETEIMEKKRRLWRPAESGDRCFYDICIFRQAGGAAHADGLACLAGQPFPKICRCLNFLLNPRDRKLVHAAEDLFTRLPESAATSPATDKRKGLREPARQSQDA